ncbi:TRZ/ATZ family hydrolase [Kushneria pakistanensis]|uniref:TRZ/ATZ family hydrolase n=1 Tax=Kushneria pakistanensis TaxID=1508770 RepID=A0ABQ3FLZ0_9GAMM|nr:amidohydrolase family protein [Kushneria pakistanensis]GHC29400.1 TRZ/ATZ family hydrolase [Kushneria pakistanensis]
MRGLLPITRRRLLGSMSALAGTAVLSKAHGVHAAKGPASSPSRVAGRWCIRNATLLTMDPAHGTLREADILVDSGEIKAVGHQLEAGDAEIIDGRHQIVMPGLVDTHNHMWQTQMRGMFGQTEQTLFFPVTQRLSDHFRPEDIWVGEYLAAMENVRAGVTTSNDFFDCNRSPNHAAAALEALAHSPLRARLLYGAQSKTTEKMTDIEHLAELHDDWQNHGAGGRLSLGLAWRLPPDLENREAMALKRREYETAREMELPISVHVSGDGHHEMFQKLIDEGFLYPGLQVVHATDARDEHMQALNDAGASLSLTPVTEHRVSYGLTRLSHFAPVRRQGLGIDGNALAGRGDMFGVMRTAALTELGASGDQTSVDCMHLLSLATSAAAESIGMGDIIGSLTPGKRADVIMIDTRQLDLGMVPQEPAAMLIFAASAASVSLVAVDGRITKRDGQMLDLDDTLYERTRSSIDYLNRFLD